MGVGWERRGWKPRCGLGEGGAICPRHRAVHNHYRYSDDDEGGETVDEEENWETEEYED